MSDVALVERLLFEAESSELDFKAQQYPFIGASDDDKSELLKDILAFANAWRRVDAYILVGIQEVKGGRSNVVGVTHHIDDASLQQFVNAKTQRPIMFSYRGVEVDGKQIGLIRIPLQQRPLYLVKDFGRLEANTVYLRRGTSTDIAKPDEIAQMGASLAVGPDTSPVCLRPVLRTLAPNANSQRLHNLRVYVRNEGTVVPREMRIDIHVPADFSVPDVIEQQQPGPPRDGYKVASKDQGWFATPLLKNDEQLFWDLYFRIPSDLAFDDPRRSRNIQIIVNAAGMEPYRREVTLAEALELS